MAYRRNGSQTTFLRNVSAVGSAPGAPANIPFTMSCVTETIDEEMWVSQSVLYTQSYSESYTPNDIGFSSSALPYNLRFRAFDDGRYTSFNELLDISTVTAPGNGNSVTWIAGTNATTATGLPVGGLSVKRPTCMCTELERYTVYNMEPLEAITVTTIEFDDGYKLDGTGAHQNKLFLGNKLMVLSPREAPDHSSSIPSFRTVDSLQVGDYVLKCTNTDPTTAKGTDCIRVSAVGVALVQGAYFAHSFETEWPQAQFPTSSTITGSTIAGIFMLENGVYIATNPSGGAF